MPNLTQVCSWCGIECDEAIVSIRHFKLSFITNGVVEEGDAKNEIRYYCSRQHRVEYMYGL